jgi:hypothetical protein
VHLVCCCSASCILFVCLFVRLFVFPLSPSAFHPSGSSPTERLWHRDAILCSSTTIGCKRGKGWVRERESECGWGRSEYVHSGRGGVEGGIYMRATSWLRECVFQLLQGRTKNASCLYMANFNCSHSLRPPFTPPTLPFPLLTRCSFLRLHPLRIHFNFNVKL